MDAVRKQMQREQQSETQKKLKVPLELERIQNQNDKKNLSEQHKFNLEIFEKQAALTKEIQSEQANLTRDMQSKQSELSKKLTKYAIIGAIVAALVGSITSTLLRCAEKYLWKENQQQTQNPTIERTTSYPSRSERPQEPNTQTSSKGVSQNTPGK